MTDLTPQINRLDFDSWKRGDTVRYADFTVKPKHDMHSETAQPGCPEPHGWVVTGQHNCNVMPGATWAKSKDEALGLIDVYCAVGGKPDFDWGLTDEANIVGQRFWHLLRAIQRMTGKLR
jgi:hypothetical protein